MNRQYGALSGVAIVLIVLNHAIHFGSQVSPVDGTWLNVLTVLEALGAFAVPTFLFVSGAFLSYAAGELSLTFIRGNLARILWPYLIWSTIFYLLQILTTGAQYPMSGHIKNLLVGYPYHFVPLLVFWYLTSPVVARIAKRHAAALVVVVGIYQAFLLVLRYPAFGSLEGLPDWIHHLKPPVLFTSMSDWAIFFPLGLGLSAHSASLRPHLFRLRWLALAAASVFFTLGILNAYEMLSAPWARFAAPVPLMFLLPIVDRGSIPFLRWFENLGKRSYGIYLSHFVVLNVVVLVAADAALGLGRLSGVIYPAFLVVGLGLPLLLMDVMAKVPPARRIYRYVFGITPPVIAIPRELGRKAPTSGGLSGSVLPHESPPTHSPTPRTHPSRSA